MLPGNPVEDQKFLAQQFLAADENGDGVISFEEFKVRVVVRYPNTIFILLNFRHHQCHTFVRLGTVRLYRFLVTRLSSRAVFWEDNERTTKNVNSLIRAPALHRSLFGGDGGSVVWMLMAYRSTEHTRGSWFYLSCVLPQENAVAEDSVSPVTPHTTKTGSKK